ncbi:MAG TPA: hypothetical protein PKO06_16890 [Candidatus Ozemobacteraceae bacterium]|nr:hypothetical protein [Candidatus Ozemobacteraceae bacterium]
MNRKTDGRVRHALFLICVLCLFFMGLASPTQAQEPDPFAIPEGGDKPAAEGGDKPAEGGDKPAGEGGDPMPANPAEDAGAPPAESGDKPSGDSSGGDSAPAEPAKSLDENEQIELIIQNHKFKLENELKDPFKPLIEKKVAVPVVVAPVNKNSGPPKPPPPPPPKPIQLFVQGVCGNENERLAMIVFENKNYTIQKDQVVDGKFKVVDILTDKLIIYSNKEQMRRTFPIGGGKE